MTHMNISPEVWGPFFWHTMHLAALGYSVNPMNSEKKAAKDFYESLVYMIPCAICKTHYADFLLKYPVTPSLDNRTDLFRWTVQIHNAVNESLGKKQVTEADSIRFYAKLGERGRSPIYTPDDSISVDVNEMMKGAMLATVAIGVTAATMWFVAKKMN